ncbi:EF hand [Rubripirellula lacrimiformis]|uniref:EF hand n=2 Tax=Rubripirellula lacrimiformis TaxID=1930273 RepID=A0A517NLT4_9BACT|nr:EF hand [Rubripirellula lacrimiformis]
MAAMLVASFCIVVVPTGCRRTDVPPNAQVSSDEVSSGQVSSGQPNGDQLNEPAGATQDPPGDVQQEHAAAMSDVGDPQATDPPAKMAALVDTGDRDTGDRDTGDRDTGDRDTGDRDMAEQAALLSGSQPQDPLLPGSDSMVAVEPSDPLADIDWHRVWVPTTLGPLIIDLDLRINDHPIDDAMNQWVVSVLEDAAAGTGDPTSWKSLADHVQSQPMLFGDAVVRSVANLDNVHRLYDRNRNRMVEVDEATRFLFQASNFASAFRVLGTRSFRHANRDDSTLWQVIDADGNGRLDDRERVASGQVIATRLDRNGDSKISIDEARPMSAGATDQAWDRRRTHRRGDVAMDLDGYIDWSTVAYVLQRDDPTLVFHIQRNLKDVLDQDQNQSVSTQEAEGLLEVPADLRLAIQWDASTSEENTGTRLDAPEIHQILSGRPMESAATIHGDSPSGGTRSLMYADDRIRVVIETVASAQAVGDSIWRWQIRGRAAEVSDVVFAWLDTNNDRSISQREQSAAADRLESVTTIDDLPDTIWIRLGRGDPALDDQTFSMSRPVVTEDQDQRPRWASAMDANQDGDISPVEFLGTPKQFANFDHNGDGFIGGDEIEAQD